MVTFFVLGFLSSVDIVLIVILGGGGGVTGIVIIIYVVKKNEKSTFMSSPVHKGRITFVCVV